MIGPTTTSLRLLARQQRLQPDPFLIGQIVSIEHPLGLPHPLIKIRGTRSKLSMDIVHPESAGVLIDRHRHIQAPFAYPALSAAARVGRRLMNKESGDQGKRGKAYFLPAGRLCGPVCVNNP